MPLTPASWSSWVRQENPSASTTAPGGACAHGGQQGGLGDGHRDVVVAALDAEVAGQPAAAADGVDLRAGRGQQRGVGCQPMTACWWQCGWATAVHAVQVGRRPAGCGRQQLGQGAGGRADLRRARVAGQQLGDLAAQHGGARRFQARRWGCRRRTAASRAATLRRSWRRAPSSWPVEIQVSPQHTGWLGELHRVAGRLEHPHRGLADLGREVLGEGVDPEQHRGSWVSGAPGADVAGSMGEPVAEAGRRRPATGAGRRCRPAAWPPPTAGRLRSSALASRGARAARAAQRGSQPSE